ncbi:MAG: hypothetical protein IPP88_04405 [Betaproteobacteria bacterium]|nr:hypothetical protein [Betaproteobacteria bacterium]
MKKLLMVSVLVTGAGLMSGLVAAQEVGKVLSSTAVSKRVTEPRSTCVDDADGRQRCRTEMVTEDRNIGYKVVYEYAGKQHTVQLPFPPGATIELDVTPAVQTLANSTLQEAVMAPERVYVDRVERVYREPVYVEPAYYPSQPYYYPGYYSSPVYPLLGVALGYTWGLGRGGYWGHGSRGWSGHRGR